jgi:XTP/dITP diphosphohydrolase
MSISKNERPLIIYLATNNAHKVGEILRSVSLYGSALHVESAKAIGGMPEVDETGSTLVENARIKAGALHRQCGGSEWVCADDTGLFVEALGGAPGVHTARYAGPSGDAAANIAKLLNALRGLPKEKRRAEFRCCLLLMAPDGTERVFEGVFKGAIADAKSGTNGFGYDPVFVPEGYAKCVAELDEDLKNRISHRALAVKQLVDALG